MWEHAVRIARRNFVMCRESSELIVPIVEEHIAVDQECTDGLLSRRRESLVDLIHGAGGQDNHLLSDATGSRLDGCGVAKGIGRIREKADQFCLWYEFTQHSESLCHQRADEIDHAGGVTAGTVHARN